MNRLYTITYPGSYLGGTAIVKASSELQAWQMVKKLYPLIDPIEQCTFKISPDRVGVLYNYNGDY